MVIYVRAAPYTFQTHPCALSRAVLWHGSDSVSPPLMDDKIVRRGSCDLPRANSTTQGQLGWDRRPRPGNVLFWTVLPFLCILAGPVPPQWMGAKHSPAEEIT